jgi:diaminopimelate decarboxylase/aspartate kinase
MDPATSRFVVLKFGGTSVATPERWQNILTEARKRLQEGVRPVIVCSAIAKASDQLEHLVREAVVGKHEVLLQQIKQRHLDLASKLTVDGTKVLAEELSELERLALGASLLRDLNPRLIARVMACGELMSTRLGAAYFNRNGLGTAWVDARECLVSVTEPGASEARRILSAQVDDAHDPALIKRFDELPQPVIISQGFIARDATGGAVLLGRGGSDTSAAYFAAKLDAVRCEIWTDVPGIFTADPRLIPSAQLLRTVGYSEAQEIASMGAKVLHPRSIAPCHRHKIPIEIRWVEHPDCEGTRITRSEKSGVAEVKAICHKKGVSLVSMDTPGMWQQAGFLADVFSCFKARGLSVDLVSTSEMNITVSLDAAANKLDPHTLEALLNDLSQYCQAKVIGPCAAVSLVGRGIRAILHRLGDVLELFEEQRIHLVSQAASDLNLTFVVDEDQAERLVHDLHSLLFAERRTGSGFGASWKQLCEGDTQGAATDVVGWWEGRTAELLALAAAATPLYVYNLETVQRSVADLRGLKAVDRLFYAMKANANVDVLRFLEKAGFGFECVSPGEIALVRELFPSIAPGRILFTPNFAPRSEYAAALELGAHVNIDNLYVLERWPELFKNRDIIVRLDPGYGSGHHAHVRTGGGQSKFGIPVDDLDQLAQLSEKASANIVGLHVHVGSGIFDPQTWSQNALFLVEAVERFPQVKVFDLGGGLGVPEKPGQAPLDLAAMDEALTKVKAANPRFEFWLEPGRYMVAQAGVLLGRVSQIKHKGEVLFVGTDVGMNTLIRPVLYGAHHQIFNLSRLGEKPRMTANVVGPICESGDVLGHSRRLPNTREGDVLLFATVGAYGRAMSSHYNLRDPAAERILPVR